MEDSNNDQTNQNYYNLSEVYKTYLLYKEKGSLKN